MSSPATIYADVYVSPTGSDSASGSFTAPVATLAKAQTLARAVASATGRRPAVCMRAGTYYQNSTLALTSADNGLQLFNYPGEQPVINGGLPIINGAWTANAGGNTGLYSIPVNLANLANGYSRCCWVNGVRLTRAATTKTTTGTGAFGVTAGTNSTGYTFSGNNNPIAAYANQQDIEFVYTAKFTDNRCGVQSSVSGGISMQPGGWNIFYPDITDANRFVNSPYPTQIENAFEILVANATPGTWYLNRTTSTLYVYPPNGVTPSTSTVVLGSQQTLIQHNGCKNVSIFGIGYAGTTSPPLPYGFFDQQAAEYYPYTGGIGQYTSHLPAIVQYNTSSNCSHIRGLLNNVGAAGINVDSGCSRIELAGNVIKDVGSTPIHVGNAYDIINPANAPSKITVDNNVCHSYGIEFRTACGITQLHGVANTITHNIVYAGNYSGISCGWGWGAWTPSRDNVITYNTVYSVMQTQSDGGGIYVNGWQVNGTLQHNVVYGLPGVNTMQGGNIYLDDGSAGWNVSGNVTYQSGGSGYGGSFGAFLINDNAGNLYIGGNTFDDSSNANGYANYGAGPNNTGNRMQNAFNTSNGVYSSQSSNTSAVCVTAAAAVGAGLTAAYSDLAGA